MRIAIAGFAREGRSVLAFLRRSPAYRQADISILDADPRAEVPKGFPARLGPGYLDDLGAFDLVVRSPGIPYNLPRLREARERGVKITSATRLFFEHCPTRNVIGVTGSKGKTTTSTLLYRMLAAAGLPARLAGNVGTPMLDILPRLEKDSWVVLELSSFQLQDLEASPRWAAILDIFPEHQDAHGSLREYYEAKKNIAAWQKRGDKVFYFIHNPVTRRLAAAGGGKKIAVSEKGFGLFRPEELAIRGLHAYRNAVMAAAIALAAGAPREAVRKAALAFKGVPHRLEVVGRKRLGTARAVFLNDSASTNPVTSAMAVKSLQNIPHILIVGGRDKNLPYEELRAALLRSPATRLVVATGENRKKILREIKGAAKTAEEPSFEGAFRAACRAAEREKGEVAVVLSPGAASFDAFKNYAERGDAFRALVRELT